MPKIELDLTYEAVDDIAKRTLTAMLADLHRFPRDDDNALHDAVLCVLEYFCSPDEYENVMASLRNNTLWCEQVAKQQRFDY
jgi:hypothetical protein